jgi:hypothetical protein
MLKRVIISALNTFQNNQLSRCKMYRAYVRICSSQREIPGPLQPSELEPLDFRTLNSDREPQGAHRDLPEAASAHPLNEITTCGRPLNVRNRNIRG